MSNRHTRRDLVSLASAGALLAHSNALRARNAAGAVPPSGEIYVHVTGGAKRFSREAPLRWRLERSSSTDSVVIDPTRRYQEILGFGAALTDASCYMLQQLAPDARGQLLRELFHPSGMGFNTCRICIGSSDYARELFSYDDGEPDPELRRFSIDHDRPYVIPVLRQARGVNPGLFLLASPWSPPGWMKAGGSMRGGSMREKYFPAYARYFARFLGAYAEAGVPIQAVSVQNEVDTDQDGRMPACLWGQEYEMGFVANHLGPLLADEKIPARIWILDHNYSLWGRAVCELDDPAVRRYVDGVAWHGYVGKDTAMTAVHDAHPDKHMYWTEGGPDFGDPHYLTNWTQWSATFAGILTNWARCIIGWNMALDEAGRPNIGPFGCGGLVTINSRTKTVTRSGMYWAFAQYSRAIRRGARRLESSSGLASLSHVAFTNPDGSSVLVLTNAGDDRTVVVRVFGAEAEFRLAGDSIATLTWNS